MLLKTEEDVIAFARHLTGDNEIEYLGNKMRTWVYKEHEIRRQGRETPSCLVVSTNGEYLLFDTPDDKLSGRSLKSGHLEDTPFGSGRSKALAEFCSKVTGHELIHFGYVDFSGFMRGSFLVPKDRTEDHSFFVIEGPDGLSVFRGENPVQFVAEDTPLEEIEAPHFTEKAFWIGEEKRLDDPAISIRCQLNIVDEGEFLSLLEAKSIDEIDATHLAGLAALHDLPTRLGLNGIGFGGIDVNGPEFSFEITVNVADWKLFVTETRGQYEGCWGDQDWYPESPEEALFELALASNANDSPDMHGFEIIDWSPRTLSATEGTPEP
ncbi:hypothetical protein [Pseudosulfitobacter pseudonitzschiae]|uniref:hypothetical protein n=1 Tax=Pseudosulfitobacter pseudonitzschiae TaxID=1402135 RepID=UPI003B7A7CD4